MRTSNRRISYQWIPELKDAWRKSTVNYNANNENIRYK